MRRRLPGVTAVLAAAVLALLGGGCATDSDESDEREDRAAGEPTGEAGEPSEEAEEPGTTLPGLPTADEAREQLAALTVAEPRPMTGYSRDRFPHWTSTDGCTVRGTVLRRDGEDVTVDDDCQPVSGTWHSAYDGEVFTDPGDIDIDHMVPLANAWRSGADEWTDEEREAFANDLDSPQLLAVGARVNREKGDQSPDQWAPPAEEFACTYARAWTAVKDSYGLTITAGERDTLGTMLDSCG
ncbi:HNH endonuclease family protein [Streptomyces litchfieldiae]|uniref:HNH endonuclease family protein n=1 Tax=Streptomyces litchfieldiae TaxID=3075543 RepID=A0ABU2MZI3_9ACTN|nr:HNH endonuclease family protein [Streptomyces sp. DSM 44938]MDT0347040.1 HNH endonuclease family protein [Streptomyces sp. DSM 44938]